MKIIILKSSILFLRIKPESDQVKCFFVFFITWNCFKSDETVFDLTDSFGINGVKKFYSNLANEYLKKYKI